MCEVLLTEDLRTLISFNLDIEDIISLCSLNREIREDCAKYTFWINIYRNKLGDIEPKAKYDNVYSYILDFTAAERSHSICIKLYSEMMSPMEDNALSRFDHEFMTERNIYVSLRDMSTINIFGILDIIPENIICEIKNKVILFKSYNTRLYNHLMLKEIEYDDYIFPQAIISYDPISDSWEMSIQIYDCGDIDEYTYTISDTDVFSLLYSIISEGICIYTACTYPGCV